MSDLISRDDLKKAFSTDMRITNFDGTRMGAGGFLVERYKVVGLINAAPAVDAVPVVHAKWVRQDDTFTRFSCSACGKKNYPGYERYCPNCGAKMDGGAP